MSDQSLQCIKPIISLWDMLSLGEWNNEVIAAEIIADCGVDAGGLTPADFEALFRGEVSVPWSDIAWSLDESLACYIGIDGISLREFGRAVVTACILTEAISRGHGDWEMSFDKMVRLVSQNMSHGDFEFRMAYFRQITAHMVD